METLGLGSPREREDNFLQRLFWPTVRNQYDVDLIGRRGFWLAFVVGVISAVALLLQRQPLAALFTLLVSLLGAAGIRERDLQASVLVFTMYFVGVVLQWIAALLLGLPFANPLISLVCIALLLSCVRATLLSRQFSDEGDEEFPTAADNGMVDSVVNRFPKLVWPRTRIPFFVLSALYLLLMVTGSARLFSTARNALNTHATQPAVNIQTQPSNTN